MTTNSVGCKELIHNKKNGLLIQPQDARSLETAITKFITMKKQARHEMGIFGREFIIKNYSEELIIKKYLLLLKNTLND